MIATEEILKFKHKNKFSKKEWNKRGLNPSSKEICKFFTDFFNSIAERLIEGVGKKTSDKEIKQLLKNELKGLNKTDLDTEEREFICDLFFELASFVNVNIKEIVQIWLYGALLEQQKETIIETLKQPCTKCKIELETNVIEKEEGIPEYGWTLAKCNNCGELNLLSIGENIKSFSHGNYEWFGSLYKDKYNYEEAKSRLEKIKLIKNIKFKNGW